MSHALHAALAAILKGPPKQYAPATLPHNLRTADQCQRPTCPHPEQCGPSGFCRECAKENAT